MCEYCETHKIYCGMKQGFPINCLDDGEVAILHVETRMLVVSDGGKYEKTPYGLRINYCPMCGRNLKG